MCHFWTLSNHEMEKKDKAGNWQKSHVIRQGQYPWGRGSITPLPFRGSSRGKNYLAGVVWPPTHLWVMQGLMMPK